MFGGMPFGVGYYGGGSYLLVLLYTLNWRNPKVRQTNFGA